MNYIRKIMGIGLSALFASICNGATMQISSDIAIDRTLSISANFLCQDGVYIYFKSQQDCQDSKVDWSCEEDLNISPIREVELILTKVGGPSVARFFKIETQYFYQQIKRDRNGNTQSFNLEERNLPFCVDRERLEPGNVGFFRYPRSRNEKVFIESMIETGITMVNAAKGWFDNISDIDVEEAEFDLPTAEIKTPYCNKSVSSEDIHLLSGEYSGNGIDVKSVQVDQLQELSHTLFVKPMILNKNAPSFEISCQKTWEI